MKLAILNTTYRRPFIGRSGILVYRFWRMDSTKIHFGIWDVH